MDYSPAFMQALAERSLDPLDPVALVAIVAPLRFASPTASLWFSAKRQLGGALEALPPLFRDRAPSFARGAWPRVQCFARSAGVPLHWPKSINDRATYQSIADLQPDVVLVAGLDQILRKKTLAALPPVFNIHPSLLPDYRGALPEFWQLDAGVTAGGVTLHRIEPSVDTGPIVLQKQFAIEPWLDSSELIERSVEVGVTMMNEFLDGYPDNVERATVQNGGSYQPVPTERDRFAPFALPAGAVFNRARAAGWESPLLVYVPRREWRSGDRSHSFCASNDDASEYLKLRLYDPVPFGDYTDGPPGKLMRAGKAGVALTCNPGTILFRRAEPETLERE